MLLIRSCSKSTLCIQSHVYNLKKKLGKKRQCNSHLLMSTMCEKYELAFSSVSEVASVMLISVAVYVIGWATLRGFTVKFLLQMFVKGKW